MRNLILTLNILVATAFLGCASVPVQENPAVVSGAPSWCDQWNTYGDQDGGEAVNANQRFMFHLGFFLTKREQLAAMIQQSHPTFDEKTMTNIMTCYEENTPALVNQLDKVCRPGTTNQEEQINKSLDTYINWCIQQNTKSA